jgi:hypothetical protein
MVVRKLRIRSKKRRKVDAEINEVLIVEAILKIVKEKKRAPTVEEIANEVNLSARAITEHYKNLSFEPSSSYLRALTPEVILSIAQSARKGSSASQKLWLQFMEGWGETATQYNVDLSLLTKEQLLRLRNGEAIESVLSAVPTGRGDRTEAQGGAGAIGGGEETTGDSGTPAPSTEATE